ncbi:MAG: PEP-CTERM sorting domain-containing protein [Verrucomicrobia bacterium]|nr:PEP-CTERM sorting domain-containing protein [Verrucomicrobiota bacterium]
MKPALRTAYADLTPVNHRLADWRLFAAAGAAGLAAAAHADASIIYVDPATKPTVTLPAGTFNQARSGNAPFAIDGVAANLAVFHHVSANFNGNTAKLAFGGGIFAGTAGGTAEVLNFARGSQVGVGQHSTSTVPGLALLGRDGTVPVSHLRVGEFKTGQTGFAGFQLPGSKGGGKGWIRIELLNPDVHGNFTTVEAIDWAYNDAGGGINAGQGIPPVPEPSSKALALLALGAGGVLAWRKARRGRGLPATTGPVEEAAA